MSGVRQAVLLDSNAYFRLGNSIRPLLKPLFGSSPQYSLYVLAELDNEYARSRRLRNKFEWVNEAEYRNDRKAKLFVLVGNDAGNAENAFSILEAFAMEQNINVSKEDLKALAVGFVKGLPVVTDDDGMTKVASAHDIECWSTIKLLRTMFTGGRITSETVAQILQYWQYENDLPAPLHRVRILYKDYFGGDCPI